MYFFSASFNILEHLEDVQIDTRLSIRNLLILIIPLSGNRDFSANKPPQDLRPVCTFKFVLCGPVEKKTEHSIFLGLGVAAR